MTVQSLIKKLELEKVRLDEALKILRPYSNTSVQIQQTWSKEKLKPKKPKPKKRKKLHWTQTPEGKARMSELQKKAWAKRV